MPYKDPEKARAYNRDSQRRYRMEHPDAIQASKRKYYLAHKEQERARRVQYELTHKGAVQERRKRWYEASREYIAGKGRQYYQAHRLEILTKVKAYAHLHPKPSAIAAIRDAHRRTRESAVPNTLTRLQWQAIKQAYRNTCAYCGKATKRLTIDHVIPVSKGGGTIASNIVPACKSCNSSKGNRLPTNVSLNLLLF